MICKKKCRSGQSLRTTGLHCFKGWRTDGGLMASAEQYGWNGSEQQFDVKPQRPFINVFQIHFHPGVKIDIVSTAHLPDAGQTRLH